MEEGKFLEIMVYPKWGQEMALVPYVLVLEAPGPTCHAAERSHSLFLGVSETNPKNWSLT